MFKKKEKKKRGDFPGKQTDGYVNLTVKSWISRKSQGVEQRVCDWEVGVDSGLVVQEDQDFVENTDYKLRVN